ncbi:MAG: SDR family oxidoreductase [Myxococcales bacterium]|nr:SDR family oxidoreductase [Myxococcales bacterium]
MDLRISGRRAAVAGASKGLGFETAKALVEEGAQVAICGRDATRIQEAAKRIGSGVTPLVADVRDPAGARRFVAEARDALGGIDILVANTGGPPMGDAVDVDFTRMQESLDLSLLSMMALCTEVVPPMQEAGWGRILGITSVGVREPLARMVYSNTARAGLTAFLKTLAREVAGDGVTVNSLLPGPHDTERLRGLMGDNLDAIGASVPAKRVGTAEEFGRVAAFLCSEWAAYLTGTAIPIAGGSQTSI